jgi:hypothetical protein
MTRWVLGAALAAASLFYPLEASAQSDDTASLKCEITDEGSVAIIENKNKTKKSSMCRWQCTYQISPGGTHINKGAKKLRAGEKKTIKKAGKNLQHVVGMVYNCP